MKGSDYSIPDTNGVSFDVEYVEIDDHKHRIAIAGNPEGTPVVVMMGVFEDSLKHTRWLVSYICLLYTSPSPRDNGRSRMPSSA